MRLVMVTGISGAGKSTALDIMEDMDYYCIDNLPPMLLETFIRLFKDSKSNKNSNIAVGIDIRGREFFQTILQVIKELNEQGLTCEILYLDSSDEVIIRRYKESRRTHPLAKDGHVMDGIILERNALVDIKENANYVLDTSDLSIWQLRQKVCAIFDEGVEAHKFPINIISFGFKHGTPTEADMIFDVRFIDNPYYVDELKSLTGLDKDVQDYVLSKDITQKFLTKFYDLIDYLIPLYIKELKGHLSIAIGCTGGKHRSVTIAQELKNHLKNLGYYVGVEHINIDK